MVSDKKTQELVWSLWSELSWLQTLSHVFVLEPFLKVLEEAVFFLHIKNRWLPLSSFEHRDLCWCLDWGWLLEFLSVSLNVIFSPIYWLWSSGDSKSFLSFQEKRYKLIPIFWVAIKVVIVSTDVVLSYFSSAIS